MKSNKKLSLNKATIVNLENVLGGASDKKLLSKNPKKCETELTHCQPSVTICLTYDAECI